MIKMLRDVSCPNTLDCPKVYGPLAHGRLAVRGDKPDTTLLAELNLPDHEGLVLVPRRCCRRSVRC